MSTETNSMVLNSGHKSKRKYIRNLLAFFDHFSVSMVVIMFLVPITWIFLTAFKPSDKVDTLTFLFKPTLDNFKVLFSDPLNFQIYFMNSLIIALGALVISVPISIFAAYSLSRFKMFGKQFLLFLILSTQFIPIAVIVLPFFTLFRDWGILDTKISLIVVNAAFALPFAIWIIKGFIDGIPYEIEEAAIIDGCSRYQIIRHFILPLARPGILVAVVLNFVHTWNEFMMALILTRDQATTLPVALMLLHSSERGIYWEQLSAAGIILVLPTVILMFLIRKHLVKGLALGAVK